MFGTKNSKMAVAALAFIAATGMGAATASAETKTPLPATENVELDRQPTGSVRNCDPSAAGAGIVCRVTRGEPNAKFPSAPIGNFGI